MRVGLVGVGDAGKHHARALLAGAAGGVLTWSAIVGRDPARLAAFRKDAAVPAGVRAFDGLAALLASKSVDAVVLATPDGVHAEQVEAAAAAGVHVLVEKPLTLTRESAERALAAARAANVHVGVGYHLRHHAAHRLMKERTLTLGTLRRVDVRWAWPDPATDGWRARGEGARFWSLAALGTHGIDLAFFFAGANVGRVAALREPEKGVDRSAEVSFLLGDVVAHVSVAVTHRAASRLVVTGDDGELEAVGTLGARGDGQLFSRTSRGVATPVAFAAEDPYAAQLRAFVARAPAGHADDPSVLANLSVLDAVPHIPLDDETRGT